MVRRRAPYSGKGRGPPSACGAGARLGSHEGSWARGQGRCALRARCPSCCPPGALVFRARPGGSWCRPTSPGASRAAVEGGAGAERWQKRGNRTRLVLERQDGDRSFPVQSPAFWSHSEFKPGAVPYRACSIMPSVRAVLLQEVLGCHNSWGTLLPFRGHGQAR